MLQKINIVNGVNTDVGKTYYCCKIINLNYAKSKRVNYIKPIISGFDYNNINQTDAGLALQSQNITPTLQNIQEITRYLLKEPLSPNIAAKVEGIKLNYNKILNFCIQNIEASLKQKIPLLIEMAGGICTPITNKKTMLDLTQDLNKLYKINNILITGNYLGAISHTITANKVFNFDKIIFNSKTKGEGEEIFKTIKNLTKRKLFWCP